MRGAARWLSPATAAQQAPPAAGASATISSASIQVAPARQQGGKPAPMLRLACTPECTLERLTGSQCPHAEFGTLARPSAALLSCPNQSSVLEMEHEARLGHSIARTTQAAFFPPLPSVSRPTSFHGRLYTMPPALGDSLSPESARPAQVPESHKKPTSSLKTQWPIPSRPLFCCFTPRGSPVPTLWCFQSYKRFHLVLLLYLPNPRPSQMPGRPDRRPCSATMHPTLLPLQA